MVVPEAVMIPQTAESVARRLLETYAAVWYVSTPAQRERVLQDAADLVREEIERLVISLHTNEH